MNCGPLVLNVNQGADFLVTVSRVDPNGNPIDLTGASFVGSIRAFAGSGVDIADLTVAILGDPTDGQYNISMSAAETDDLPVNVNANYQNVPTLWTFDIKMTQDSVVTRILQGTISVSPQVTP